MNKLLFITCVVPVLSYLTYAQNSVAQNGIEVGPAKVFDNRTLTLMLNRLNTQLTGVQVVDQGKLTGALGTLQGFQSRESSSSISAQASATPTTRGTAPTDPTVFNTFTPPTDVKSSLSAGDLLNEQVNLTYQIFNLQTLLDRSISDRLRNGDPRLQVLLGFDVSLLPNRDASDSAAFVEVTVRMEDSDEPVSVVALMPQEHTYNAAALSTKSSAFGGSAVTQIATVGYNSRRRSQTYYLFRDTDTVSFERRQPPKTSSPQEPKTQFGWQFRPVLGRRSVSPGSRQMFAVLSLPASDAPDDSAIERLKISVKTYWRKYSRATLTTIGPNETSWWGEAGHVLGLGIHSVYPLLAPEEGDSYTLPVPKTASFQQDLSPQVDHVSWSLLGSKQLLVSVTGKNFFNDSQVAIGGKVVSGSALQIKSDQAFDFIVEPSDPYSGVLMGRYGSAVPLVNSRDSTMPEIDISDVMLSDVYGGYLTASVCLANRGGGGLAIQDLPHTIGPRSHLLEPIFSFNGALLGGSWTFTDMPNGICGSFPNNAAKVRATATVAADPFIKGKKAGLFAVVYPFSDAGLRASFPLNDPNDLFEAQLLASTGTSASILVTNKLFKEIGWSPAWSAIIGPTVMEQASLCTPRSPAGVTPVSRQAETRAVEAPKPIAPAKPVAAMDQPKNTENTPVPPSFCFLDNHFAILTVPVSNSPLGQNLMLNESVYGGTYFIPLPTLPDKTKTTATPVKAPPTIAQYDSLWVQLDEKSITDPIKAAQIDGQTVLWNALPKEGPPFKTVEVFVTRTFSAKPGKIQVNFFGTDGAVLQSRPTILITCTECQTSIVKEETKK